MTEAMFAETVYSAAIDAQAHVTVVEKRMQARDHPVLLGVPEPLAIFMLTFFGAYIPFIGAFLSGLLAVMLAIGDSGLRTGVAMLAIVIGVQVLEGNVLQPWIQGRAVKLHPLVIALSVTAGGAIAGFLGVLLAVPLTATGVVALSELRAAGLLGPADLVGGPDRIAEPPPQS